MNPDRSRYCWTLALAAVVALGAGCKFVGLDPAGTYEDIEGVLLSVTDESDGACTAELLLPPGPQFPGYPDGVVWPTQDCTLYEGEAELLGRPIPASFMAFTLDSDDLPPELTEDIPPIRETQVMMAYASSPESTDVQHWLYYAFGDEVVFNLWSFLTPAFTRVPES